jgi:oligosaccharyltransferase complex subunit epsilon
VIDLELQPQAIEDHQTQRTPHKQHPNKTNRSINPTMAPKKNISTTPSPSAVPTSAAKPTAGVTSASGQPTRAANKPSSTTTGSTNNGQVRNAQDLQNIGLGVWNKYVDQTPQRVKLLDAFLVFLMAVGVLQFVYCVIAGNFVSIHLRNR